MSIPPTLSPELEVKRIRLRAILRELGSVAVAFSGGIDSTVLAYAAREAIGDNALAVTADSPSVPREDLEDARNLSQVIGIRHIILPTEEFADPDYVRNDGARCYYCKSELYDQILSRQSEWRVAAICSGANLDDLGDYRPGLTAAAERGIRHPLQEAGFTKADVRELAKYWGLPTWDKPASPCLSSRLAPGVEVTVERTGRVETAEAFLRSLGLRELRVRLHEGELARIEVPAEYISHLADAEIRARIVSKLKELGFRFVTLDLVGFQSGSLNALVDVNKIRLYTQSSTGNSSHEK